MIQHRGVVKVIDDAYFYVEERFIQTRAVGSLCNKSCKYGNYIKEQRQPQFLSNRIQYNIPFKRNRVIPIVPFKYVNIAQSSKPVNVLKRE